jgi:hypothetical protein
MLVKNLKICERNIQELSNSINRPNLRIMGTEEGEEVQAKEICNIFNKKKIYRISRKFSPFQVQEASRTPIRHDQNRTSSRHIIIVLDL